MRTLLLGILYAALGAFTFALNNATMRRGVVTGSVLQAMALTVPIGGLSFLAMTVAFGEIRELFLIPAAAMLWLACQGVVHFVMGRYCNYRANQLMGVNLAAPVRPFLPRQPNKLSPLVHLRHLAPRHGRLP